jgi:predicted ATPase
LLVACFTGRQFNDALPLTETVHGKTKGNALFSLQSIRLLQEESMLYYSAQTFRWEWDTDKIISETQISDNAVDLMVSKLNHLPPGVQQVLQIGACLGSRFRSSDVAHIRNEGGLFGNKEGDSFQTDTLDDLSEEAAPQELLAHRAGTSIYRFSQDKKRQAAYSLLHEGPVQPDHDSLH